MKFNHAFSRKETVEVPKKWIEYINDNAPEGTYYHKINEHEFHLLSEEDDSFQFKFKNQTLPDWFPKVQTDEEFWAVFNNAQRPIEVKKPRYYIQDKEIEKEDVLKDFTGQIKDIDDGTKHIIKPIEFPEAVQIKIKANNNEYRYHLKRVPLISIHEKKFETIDDKIVKLSFIINEKKDRIKFKLNIDFNKANNVAEIIKNKDEISDFINGPHIIFGKDLKIYSEDVAKALNEILNFYLQIDEVFTRNNITDNTGNTILLDNFNIQNVTTEELIDMEKIYISFIEDKLYYNDYEHQDLLIHYEADKLEEITETTKDKELAISGFKELEFDILNVRFNLYEQFIFKKIRYKEIVNIEKDPVDIKYEVLEDRIQYRKLYRSIPSENHMELNMDKIEHAVKIERS